MIAVIISKENKITLFTDIHIEIVIGKNLTDKVHLSMGISPRQVLFVLQPVENDHLIITGLLHCIHDLEDFMFNGEKCVGN
jgi:hypothetical protein